MSTVIAIDDRGIATLEIEAPGGEVRSYLMAPVPADLDIWAVTLSHVGGEAGPYRVAIDRRGRWHCDCPAFRYRRSKEHPRGCKHSAAVRRLHALLQVLSPAPAPALARVQQHDTATAACVQ